MTNLFENQKVSEIPQKQNLEEIQTRLKGGWVAALKSPYALFRIRDERRPYVISSILNGEMKSLQLIENTYFTPPGEKNERIVTYGDLGNAFEEAANARQDLSTLAHEATADESEQLQAVIMFERTENLSSEIQLTKFYLQLQNAKRNFASVSDIEDIYFIIKTLQEKLYGVLNESWAVRMMSNGRTQQLAQKLVELDPKLMNNLYFRKLLSLPVKVHADQDVIGEHLEYLKSNVYSQIEPFIPKELIRLRNINPDAHLTGEEQLHYMNKSLDTINLQYGLTWKATQVPGTSYSVGQNSMQVKVPSTVKSVNSVLALLVHEIGVHVLRSANNPLVHPNYAGFEEGLAISMQRIASEVPIIHLTKIDAQTLLYCLYAIGGSVQDMVTIARSMELNKERLIEFGFESNYLNIDYHLRRTFRGADQAPGTSQGIIDYKDLLYPDGLTDFARLLRATDSKDPILSSACKKLLNASLLSKANYADAKTVQRLQKLGIVDLSDQELDSAIRFMDAKLLTSRL